VEGRYFCTLIHVFLSPNKAGRVLTTTLTFIFYHQMDIA